MGVCLFFSYAHGDRDDRLERFYQRLSKEVGKAKQLSECEAGFFDQRSIEVGDVWDRKGFRTAMLVCVCSANSSLGPLAAVLQACIDRVLRLHTRSTAIFPIIWDWPDRSQHPALNKYQYTHKDLPPIYADKGLNYIMGPSKHADDYEEFVMHLA